MEQFYFQSLPGDVVTFVPPLRGETPESLYFIKTPATPITPTMGGWVVTGEPVEVELHLTVPQMAAIVKHFFRDVSSVGTMGKFLCRLLEKRWAVRTHPFAKDDERMRYARSPF